MVIKWQFCNICKEEYFDATQACSGCDKVVKEYQNKTKYPMEKVRNALKDAYSHKDTYNNESYFKCKYTGIIGKFNSKIDTVGTYKDAFILTLDHKNPPDKELVVSLNRNSPFFTYSNPFHGRIIPHITTI